MTRLRCLLALVILFAIGVSAMAARQNVGPRVAAATAAFRLASEAEGLEARRAAFRTAAELYEIAIVERDGHMPHVNGGLEFNTGNAWFLAGDTGRAILHYRRSALLRPGDPQVEANLQTARARRRDQIDDSAGRAVAETIFFWHRGLGYRTKLWVSLGAWVLLCGFLSVGVLARARGNASPSAWRGVVLALVVLVAVGGSFGWERLERIARDAAVVLAEQVDIRTGDGDIYPARYENPIHAGAEVSIRQERAEWVEIELPDGKTGWVPKESVERI